MIGASSDGAYLPIKSSEMAGSDWNQEWASSALLE
jgi:hypothetical protein